ncbi:MAG: AraC family transcriptional regulator [Kiritimatiellae bacterium]|nr:AraC family transcriptional regulator [Kiritimatiellia bacterium]
MKQKEELLWQTRFYSIKKVENLPRALGISCSNTTNHAMYYNHGKDRISEKNQYVFQYSLKGFGALKIGEITHTIKEKQAFLVDVSDPNIIYYLPKENREGWNFMFFVFEDKSLQTESIIKEYGHLYDLSNDLHIVKKLMHFKDAKEKVLEISTGESIILVNSLLCSLIDIASSVEHTGSTNAKIIRKSYKLIEQNLRTPYNVAMLADDLNISQEHLSRVFAKEIRISPYKLIMKIKMREACTLLKDTTLPIKDIALRVGNEPGSHFARAFKNEIGESPGEFRKRGVMPY